MATIVQNVRTLGDSGRRTLCLENARIRKHLGVPQNAHPSDVIIDGSGRVGFEGFVNAHTHLAMSVFRGLADDVPLQTWLKDYIWPIEQRMTPQDVYWCTLLGIAEGIRCGTTAFIDMYFHNEEIARAVDESGVRMLITYGMIAASLQDGGISELAKTKSLIKRWHGQANGRIQVSVGPHAVYTCGENVIRAAVDMAHKYKTSIHIHVAETRSEVDDWTIKTGRTPVEHLHSLNAFSVPVLAAHCVHVNADDITLLADHPVTVAHCPKSNAKLGSGIAPVAKMKQAGVSVALGTDGAASNNRLDMLEELRAAWILQRACHEDPTLLTAQEVVSMAITPARVLFGLPSDGLSDGAPADLVLLDTQHTHTTPDHDPAAMLAYATSASDVTDVYVDGKALLENGELRTIDEERVKSEVRRLLHRITNR